MFCILYIACALALLIAGYTFKDEIWYLAIINSFRYWLFVPAFFFLLRDLWQRKINFFKFFCLSLLILIWLYSYILPRGHSGRLQRGDLRLITCNILFKNHDMNRLARILTRYEPDIIAFQELRPRQARSLNDLLKEEYSYRSFENPDRVWDLGIWSKLPILSSVSLHSERGELVLSTIEYKEEEFYVVNVHAQSPEPKLIGEGRFQALESIYHGQEKMLESLSLHLHRRNIPVERVILMGDFNSTSGNYSHQIIRNMGLQDAYRALESIWPVWSFTFPVSLAQKVVVPPVLRLDYIYVGAQFLPVRGRILPELTGSDHRPVLIELHSLMEEEEDIGG
jgi:endonuclease/exonuclease/phosphatase (EEP) superfamily protein YafD